MSLGRLGDYEILERIGQGGMGVVFKARDTRLDRVVALKALSAELAADPEARARLMREARAEAALSHPNIATCFEVGEAVPTPRDLLCPGEAGPHPERVSFLAMEFVPGEDLLTLLERKPLPVAHVIELAIQVASGLETAHDRGVVHRDLKPSNVRVTPSGQVKILDFGLARVLTPAEPGSDRDALAYRTSEGRVMGTAPYMSPEQGQGRTVDARSDLFSLGVLIYQLVTGRLPFTGGSSLEVLYAISAEEPQPLARYARQVPEELERIVRKLLAKRPEDRYQSAHEVLTDLRRLQADGASATRGRARAGTQPRRLAFVLVPAGVLLAVVAALVWVWMRGVADPPSRNVAVLAFENASGDSTQDLVGAALAEDVRGDLIQHTDLNVASRASTAGLPAGERAPKSIARELGVGSILLGTVRRGGEGPRLEVELVGGRTGFVRWSGAWDLLPSATLRIKRELVEQVGAHLRAKMDFGSAGHAPGGTHDYADYMRGMQELEDPDDPQAADRAADRFGVALAFDPDFALAWAGRARALMLLYQRDQRPEALRSAAAAADQAVRLAPDLVEALVARSEIDRATGRTDRAIAGLKQVIARRPNWDEACVQLAATYRNAGRLAEAERWYRRAVELRPDYWGNWNSLGTLLLRHGDYAGARTAFERIVKLVPEKNRGFEQLAAIDLLEGKVDQAIAEYRRLPTPTEDGDLASNIGTAFYYLGRMEEARALYLLAVRLKPNDPIVRQNLGDCLQRLGRPDEAHAAYREAVRLIEAELARTPDNPDLRVRHATYLAKAGDCAAAARVLAGVAPQAMRASADCSVWAARAYSVCGDRARALAALRQAIGLGYPAQGIAGEDEFAPLRDDPDFRRLTGSRGAGATPAR